MNERELFFSQPVDHYKNGAPVHFQIVLQIKLYKPLPLNNTGGVFRKSKATIGYCKTFGVNADNHLHAITLVLNQPDFEPSPQADPDTPGDILEHIECTIINPAEWPEEVTANSKKLDQPGIYFESGTAYYADR